MKKSCENITALLRKGASVTLRSDDFRFSELLGFARIANSSETSITLVVGDSLTLAEVLEIANTAHGHLQIDLSEN